MQTTSINVFAYDKETRRRINTHAVYSRSFPGSVPVPTKGEKFGHLSWTFPVFDVVYTYLNDTVRVDISVWAETDEQKQALLDVR
jgi:hypothetical protein